MKIWSLMLAFSLAFLSMTDAEAARRLGGGQSVGKQSSNVTNKAPPAASPQQGTPAQQAKPAQPTPPTPAPSRPWMGILGGVAAGLGLAWLASSLGMGAGFANFMMFALVAVVLFAVVAVFMRRRAQSQQPAYAGMAPSDAAAEPRQYNPDKIGNDASARPWERSSMAFEPAKVAGAGGGTGLRIGSALESASGSWDVPAGFDTAGFITAAKANFITLQGAWDKGDLGSLRSMMTDEMLSEIRKQLAERGPQPNHTEVVMLEAKLLGIEDLGDDYMASVEFSGMIREEPSAGPSPFREVWNMTKPKDGSIGWLVAGLQALQ